MVKQFNEKHWGWIVPVILMLGAVIAVITRCGSRASAAELQPSPTPTHDVVGTTIGINALGLIGAAVFVGVMILLAVRNMKKHSS